MELFKLLEFETASYCQRKCPDCVRNSHPNRLEADSWTETPSEMPLRVIHKILNQAVDLGFTGAVNLSFYNEPFEDPRIYDIARYAKSLKMFNCIRACTHYDIAGMGPIDAARIDECFDYLMISRVRPETNGFIKHTVLDYNGDNHMTTHYNKSGMGHVLANAGLSCGLCNCAMLINHKGDACLCFEDLIGEFNLGNIHNTGLKELWFGEKRTKIVESLRTPGNRALYPYCRTCPRNGVN
jgi:radical SAM protein with 4Fe4S-binding SPASM domain